MNITENTVVRLKKKYSAGGRREKGVVIGFIPDVKGGVIVHPKLENMCCWNIEHLEVVGDGRPTAKNLRG